MKEIVVTYTAEITEVVEVPDDIAESTAKRLHEANYAEELSGLLKKHLFVENVKTMGFKTRIRDKAVAE